MKRKLGRILSLDIGEKVIGIALSDENQTLATPHPPIIRNVGSLRLGQFRKIIDKFQVKTIIYGLPIFLDGRTSRQTQKTKAFVNKLKKHFPSISFLGIDERLSTETVQTKYSRLKLTKNATAINIDSFAAMEILESFFLNQNHKNYRTRTINENLPQGFF